MNNNSHAVILGVESSCDDTAAAVLINGKVESNCVANQEVHSEYGGVVPELASRKHQQNIVPVVNQALKIAGIKKEDITAVACTQGPGLLGSLLVGYTFSKGLAMSLGVPLINVNHIDAHIWAHYIEDPSPKGKFLCLLVSGGHTQIILVDEQKVEVLGSSLDDAAGEAFDKAGKMLGLPYPAGPEIDQRAKNGDPLKYSFSTSSVGELNFSFSGLKTSVKYFLQDQIKDDPDFIQKNINDLCASIQHTIVSYLMSKLHKAVEIHQIDQVGIAGGVAANSMLRARLHDYCSENGLEAFIPAMEHCTDNAAMIAQAGYMKYNKNEFGTLNDVCFTRYE
ncbi:MAG: tRNA (adenosine(37)-N6)-threonylcarbamoyltransferase complex transferase subunit TsaD [Bacteroidia bacterium]